MDKKISILFWPTIKFALALPIVFLSFTTQAQGIVVDDFEGKKSLHYGERSGVLDTLAKNPAPNKVNGSQKCALYVRNGAKKFANIKMNLQGNLTGVEAYATYLGIPPKLKMKVYTTAPAGTLVEVLLGSRNGNNDYPAGTHSQYQAYTTVSNQWEELEFKFSQIPQGSETSSSQIDQAVLLFNPNSSTSDTYYFDELTLPPLKIKDTSASVTPENEQKNQAVNETQNQEKQIKEQQQNNADKSPNNKPGDIKKPSGKKPNKK